MHYLDHAATTPVLPEVAQMVGDVLSEDYGNPSSVHAFGRRARELVEDARERVAIAAGASPAEIVFTGGGTEADNLALKGAAAKLRGNGKHIVTTAIEHHAVLDTVGWLAKQGFDTTKLPVTATGHIQPDDFGDAVRPQTILASVMAVNNETGTI